MIICKHCKASVEPGPVCSNCKKNPNLAPVTAGSVLGWTGVILAILTAGGAAEHGNHGLACLVALGLLAAIVAELRARRP